jgi:hypothetical protein
MRVYLDPYLLKLPQVRSIGPDICDGDMFVPSQTGPPEEESWTLSWGYPITKRRHAVAETGFFWDAMHIDTLGLYQFSSLNTICGRTEIDSFEPPCDSIGLINHAPLPKSKYRQPSDQSEWAGVVFACQNPTDRSIHSVASTQDWWRFYEDCCRYYGSRLFVKLHPWNQGDTERRIREIGDASKCTVGRAGHRLIESCEHVVLFNSTFSVDCMVRGIPVKQGAPGYFYQTGAVTYCCGQPERELSETVAQGKRLVDFLVWRYCFTMDCTLDEWRDRLRAFASSRNLFPLPIEGSYGAYLQKKIVVP